MYQVLNVLSVFIPVASGEFMVNIIFERFRKINCAAGAKKCGFITILAAEGGQKISGGKFMT
mgnify:FL=1